jgi:hypothetical protein
MSMPSLDFLRSTPPTEQLRIESEPPGADATTSQGQTCRTPCELTVPSAGELSITFALNGYQQMTVPVRLQTPAPGVTGEPGGPARLQPNPVYAELQPIAPPRPAKKKRPVRKKPVAKKQQLAPASPEPVAAQPPPPPPPAQAAPAPAPATGFPGGYPWPPAPQ